MIIPKGFFPQQDNGFLTGVSEASQDISFAEMKRHQEELSNIVQADPAVDSIAMFIGGGGTALNSGRMYITLKPHDERDVDAQQIIARLRPKLAKVEGAKALSAGLAGRAARRPRHADAIRIHAAGRQSHRAERMGAEDPGQDADAAAVARCRHRPADRGHDAAAHHRSRHRLALRHPAAADRRHAVRRVRSAPGHAIFHPAQLLSRDHRNPARTAGQARHAATTLYPFADHGRAGAALGVLQMDECAGASARRSRIRASSRR